MEKNNLSFYGSPPDSSGGALYIHIPFCKQACHYCDFHFSTSLRKKPELVRALCKEMVLRKEELTGEIESVYFGGGTPSLLSAEELQQIFQTVFSNFRISDNAEITLEANPDDLTNEKLEIFSSSPINRLSIGIQSFFDRDLKLMNRSHNYNEALQSIKLAENYFKNISIDLIYGIPGLTDADWMRNL
ncbi:MAG TPA: radical SAM protein, partial [Salinimicrobium sp.]|nr:radical SAM protein [Salinimicrobium sp.]